MNFEPILSEDLTYFSQEFYEALKEEAKDFENVKKFINLGDDEDPMSNIDEEYLQSTLDKFKPYFNQNNQNGGLMGSLAKVAMGSFTPSPLILQY